MAIFVDLLSTISFHRFSTYFSANKPESESNPTGICGRFERGNLDIEIKERRQLVVKALNGGYIEDVFKTRVASTI